MAKLQFIEQPDTARYKELASCLDRLQQNPDWDLFFNSHLFGEFLTANVQNLQEPTTNEQVGQVKYSLRNVQNVNWLKGYINFIYDVASEDVKKDENA